MTYHDFYAGTLDATRQLAIQNYLAIDFAEMELEADLARRGVNNAPPIIRTATTPGCGGTRFASS